MELDRPHSRNDHHPDGLAAGLPAAPIVNSNPAERQCYRSKLAAVQFVAGTLLDQAADSKSFHKSEMVMFRRLIGREHALKTEFLRHDRSRCPDRGDHGEVVQHHAFLLEAQRYHWQILTANFRPATEV